MPVTAKLYKVACAYVEEFDVKEVLVNLLVMRFTNMDRMDNVDLADRETGVFDIGFQMNIMTADFGIVL